MSDEKLLTGPQYGFFYQISNACNKFASSVGESLRPLGLGFFKVILWIIASPLIALTIITVVGIIFTPEQFWTFAEKLLNCLQG